MKNNSNYVYEIDYDNNIKSYKKWLKLIMILFVFIFDNQSVSFYYQSVFLVYIIVVSNYKLKHRQLLFDKVLKVLVIFLFVYLFFEAVTILVLIDIIRDKSLILKRIEYLNLYKIIIIVIVIYASLVYKMTAHLI